MFKKKKKNKNYICLVLEKINAPHIMYRMTGEQIQEYAEKYGMDHFTIIEGDVIKTANQKIDLSNL